MAGMDSGFWAEEPGPPKKLEMLAWVRPSLRLTLPGVFALSIELAGVVVEDVVGGVVVSCSAAGFTAM
jgi:hypothetical protein